MFVCSKCMAAVDGVYPHRDGESSRFMVPVQESFEEKCGTTLDSGKTFMGLPSETFVLFKEAVSAYALEHGLYQYEVKGSNPMVSVLSYTSSALLR